MYHPQQPYKNICGLRFFCSRKWQIWGKLWQILAQEKAKNLGHGLIETSFMQYLQSVNNVDDILLDYMMICYKFSTIFSAIFFSNCHKFWQKKMAINLDHRNIMLTSGKVFSIKSFSHGERLWLTGCALASSSWIRLS